MGWGDRESSAGATFTFLGSLQNLTTGLIWLVTRAGGWRAGKGGDGGGHQRAVWD